jgi:hypothetical protein
VRGIVARFLNAARKNEIVFTSGTTEGINLVSYGWAAPRLQPGDEIVLSIMEHHANIVPWHFLRERQGVVLKWVECDANGDLDPQAVLDAIGPRTKLVAVTHMSNVLGTVVDVAAICAGARARACRCWSTAAGGRAHAGGRAGDRLRFLRDHGAQALRPLGVGRDLDPARADGRDAPLPGRRRHDPRGDARHRHLQRPADEVRGGHARHRPADRLGVALDYMMGWGWTIRRA